MKRHRYAVLLNQGHNRVYYESSKLLSIVELMAAADAFSEKCENIELMDIGNVFYVVFDTAKHLSSEDVQVISKLSFAYALFELIGGSEVLLKPVRLDKNKYFNDDLSMILKYTGKTNEIFTRLLINVAVFAAGLGKEEGINLLDPVAGKGTTLFEGLMCGYNCYGVEIGSDAAHECVVFLKKYLEAGKYKHSFVKSRLSGENKSFTAEVAKFEIAMSKEEAKSGNFITASMTAGDSRYAIKYFKKEFFDVIVGDLPYGVQHGSVTRQKQSSVTRNPDELLNTCLPGWLRCLKVGGIVALSWNTFVLGREAMAAILEAHSLKVINEPPYNGFEHKVDQAIKRDIILAKKQ